MSKSFPIHVSIASYVTLVAAAFVIGFSAVYKNAIIESLRSLSKDFFYNTQSYTRYSSSKKDEYWANEILKGGYILHFRHAERDKWIDVQMYDLLEAEFPSRSPNDPQRLGENEYFNQAVCLNSRGLIQAKAMGEHIRRIGLPFSQVLSSPSCRARQTAEIVFGEYSNTSVHILHEGTYNEKMEERINILKDLYSGLKLKPGFNTVISSHNTVISPLMFENQNSLGRLNLEEGGFYVISSNPNTNKLKLEHEFNNFKNFARVFYTR